MLPIHDLGATAFCVCPLFLRQKIINNAVFHHRCYVNAGVFALDVATDFECGGLGGAVSAPGGPGGAPEQNM